MKSKRLKNTVLGALMVIGFGNAVPAMQNTANDKVLHATAGDVSPTSLDLSQPTLFLVPYSHLDDVWRWSYPVTIRDFLKNTLDENFESFSTYPHFSFNWTGASRYAMMKEYYPEKYKELKKWVDAGRWNPAGSSWVENDTVVPSTESLLRQLLMGRTYFQEEFAKESLEYMLPDCFGFPYSLPSVLNHCGIRGFSTQKLTWGSANGIPFNIGKWQGPDGESVIAALNCDKYSRPIRDMYPTHQETLERLRANEEVCGLPIDYYYMGGGDRNNHDRGGTPHKESLENLEKMMAMEGPVNVVSGPADTMFRAITDEQKAAFPTWNSDLLLIQHSTGVLTSQAYCKQLNRDGELLADAAERAAVTANLLTGAPYPGDALNRAWGLLLRNQFHDTLPGTSLPEAYECAWNDGIIALNQFDGAYKDAVGSLARSLWTAVPGVPVVVYNPLSIEREDIVEALIPDDLAHADSIAAFTAEGEALPTQLTTGWDGKRRILFPAKVPAVGAAVYSLREAVLPVVKTGELTVKNQTLENQRYRVVIDENGDMASVFDKQLDKELFATPAQLEFLENFPTMKPAWRVYWKDISKPARSVAADPRIRIVENGPLRIAIEVVRENEGSRMVQHIRLYAGEDGNRVEVANHLDWKTRGALLKAAFHLNASNPEATYGLGLGTIRRGNAHEKQYEVPAHGWIDLTDQSGAYGFSILTGHKYGSDKPDDNTLRLTLMHSPDTEASDEEMLDTGHGKEMRWQDWGRHEFNYAIAGHGGDWRDGEIYTEARRFEQRPAAFVVPQYSGQNGTAVSLLNINNPQVNIQAVKMAEDGSGVVVRLQELSGRPQSGVKLSAALPIKATEKLDGTERPLGETVNVENLDFTPYELKTVLLNISGAPVQSDKTLPVKLNYDTDVFTYNTNREDGHNRERYNNHNPGRKMKKFIAGSGSFNGKGETYPAEMIGDTVQVGNVSFVIGSREDYTRNALSCRGQKIALPEGTTVVHLLAAAKEDTDVVFKAGETSIPLTVGGWSGFIGLWDNRVFEGEVAELSYSLQNDLLGIEPAYIRDQRVAWYASHRHTPAADTLYKYGYMFAYRLEIPKGATHLTLPDERFVRILAMSVGDEGHAEALQSPFEDLYRDQIFAARFLNLRTAAVNE